MDQDRPTASSSWLPPGAPEPVGVPGAGSAPVGPSGGSFGEPRPSLLKRLTGPLLAALALILKFGKIALLALPKLKVLTTSGSMLVSVAAYSLIWGWKFAAGFVILLFVHEMGHVIQLRREGIAASAPVFIPFLGAAVWSKSLGEDAAAEARVGLAGPVLGSIGAGVVALAGWWTDSDFLLALAFTGFFLNLFNLLPIVPLDGGRAMAALSPWMWLVGVFGLVVLVLTRPNPIIILIALLGIYETYRRYKALKSGDPDVRRYYRVSKKARALTGIVYLGLIVALVLGMDLTHVVRDFGDV